MRPAPAVLLLGLLLSACGTNTGGARSPRTYAWSFDSPSNACRANPANCAAMGMARKEAAEAGASLAAALKVLDDAAKEELDQLMRECAQWADAEVNQLRMDGQRPTRKQCQELVEDAQGQAVTRAMQLGTEKHEFALRCVQEKLGVLRPGGFSLKQRYGYDRRARRVWLLSDPQTQSLLQQGQGKQLVGTLVPDVVIHAGHPLRVLAIYDFKFPCPGTNEARWATYSKGHPYHPDNQGTLYYEALGTRPFRVSPNWGIE